MLLVLLSKPIGGLKNIKYWRKLGYYSACTRVKCSIDHLLNFTWGLCSIDFVPHFRQSNSYGGTEACDLKGGIAGHTGWAGGGGQYKGGTSSIYK